MKITRPWMFALGCFELFTGVMFVLLSQLSTRPPLPIILSIMCLVASAAAFVLGVWTISLAVTTRCAPGDRW